MEAAIGMELISLAVLNILSIAGLISFLRRMP